MRYPCSVPGSVGKASGESEHLGSMPGLHVAVCIWPSECATRM
jgi:hypothetical protein